MCEKKILAFLSILTIFPAILIASDSKFPQKSYKEYEIEINRSFPDKEQELREIYLAQPFEFDVDNDENIWITDFKLHKLFKFNYKGELLAQYGGFGQGPNEFQRPSLISYDKNVAVKDVGNSRIVILNDALEQVGSFKYLKGFYSLLLKDGFLYLNTFVDEHLVTVLDINGDVKYQFGELFKHNHPARMFNEVFIKSNRKGEIILAWKFFPIIKIYTKKGELLKSMRVEDDWIDKTAKRNNKTGESVDNPNRVDLVQIISGLYANEDRIYILVLAPETKKIFEINYSGEIECLYWMNGEAKILTGIYAKKENNGIRFLSLETFPDARVIEMKLK